MFIKSNPYRIDDILIILAQTPCGKSVELFNKEFVGITMHFEDIVQIIEKTVVGILFIK